MKLAQYLKQKYPNLTNRALKRALEQGACTVNGKIERFASRIIEVRKDKIIFRDIETKAIEKLTIKKPRIVFEDEHILVYDKEAGHPMMATESAKQVNLHQELKQALGLKFLEPAHRLDKDTSGLVVFVKTPEALRIMNEQFKEKDVDKKYEAIVDGKWSKHKKGRIENHLKLKHKMGAMQVWEVAKTESPRTKHAITDYEVLKTYDKYSHVLLIPRTGRTHQLRVHLAILGHPILGDTIYAHQFSSGILVKRHLLHASELEFLHHITKKRLKLKATRPDDLAKMLKD